MTKVSGGGINWIYIYIKSKESMEIKATLAACAFSVMTENPIQTTCLAVGLV
jgi:hypothetical protein